MSRDHNDPLRPTQTIERLSLPHSIHTRGLFALTTAELFTRKML